MLGMLPLFLGGEGAEFGENIASSSRIKSLPVNNKVWHNIKKTFSEPPKLALAREQKAYAFPI
jgi:hypothetical protein